ncbi:uncharacterized protein PRCAT00004850001 [Priceomyces carsonii]|uniref:uncharacterized protein n=1 Tax=Priceomyces carsonii TaxID=28549 RepID=UPI002EDB8FAF|nr:unnamed protein product [Priceomyces carsonii]
MVPFKPVRRLRRVLTCLNCKKKKTRCDRNKPCSACIKCNKADSCRYEVQDPSAEKEKLMVNIVKQIQNLKLQLAEYEPIDGDYFLSVEQSFPNIDQLTETDDKINFPKVFGTVHYRESDNKLAFGPPLWYSILRHDSFTNQVRRNLTELLPPTAYTKANVSTTSILYEDGRLKDQKFRELLISREGLDQQIIDNRVLESLDSLKKSKEDQVQPNLFNLKLVTSISTILPSSGTIWRLLDFFFLHVHPCIPYLDETQYRDNVVQILGPPTDNPVTNLSMTKKLDFAPIGTLLVILRLTFLFTYSNNKWANELRYSSNVELLSEEDKQIRFIHETHIGEEFIILARSCLNQFDMDKRINLSILQCLNFVEFYNVYGPESGNGIDGCNSHSATSNITKACYCMGLNREPTRLNDHPDNGLQESIGRKLWFKLMRDDLEHCLTYGRPPFVDVSYCDVKPIGSFGQDFVNDFDRTLSEFDTWFQNNFSHFSKVVEIMLNTSKQFTKLEISSRLESFEAALMGLKISRCIQKGTTDILQDQFVRHRAVHENKFSLCMLRSIIDIYTLIMFDSERKKEWELALNYIKKYMTICTEKIIPLILDSFDGLTSDYGIFMNQYNIMALQSMGQLYYGLLLRILSALNPVKKTAKNHDSLRELAHLVRQICQRLLEIMDQLTDRFFQAWRIAKMFRWYKRNVTGKTHLAGFEDHPNVFAAIDGVSLIELKSIMDTTLSRLNSFMEKLGVGPTSEITWNGETSLETGDFALLSEGSDAWFRILLDQFLSQ